MMRRIVGARPLIADAGRVTMYHTETRVVVKRTRKQRRDVHNVPSAQEHNAPSERPFSSKECWSSPAGCRPFLEESGNQGRIVLFNMSNTDKNGKLPPRFTAHGNGLRELSTAVIGEVNLRILMMRHNTGAVLFPTEELAAEASTVVDGALVGDFLHDYHNIAVRAAVQAHEVPEFAKVGKWLEELASLRVCKSSFSEGLLAEGMDMWLHRGGPVKLVEPLIAAHELAGQLPQPMEYLRYRMRWMGSKAITSAAEKHIRSRQLAQRDRAYVGLVKLCAQLRENELMEDLLQEMEYLDVHMGRAAKIDILALKHAESRTAADLKAFCTSSSLTCQMHQVSL